MKKIKLKSIALSEISIKDSFWNRYIDLVDEIIIPFLWELINDNVEGAKKSHCIQNFKIASGKEQGEHQGSIFQDTDVSKWLEAVAYSLAKKRNPKIEKMADEAIELIAHAQCEDGYLNTYYTIKGKERWKNLFEGHELYTAGHLIEAAVAYYEATGKAKIMEVACRFADYLCEVFGKEENKIHGYPGHPEIELALVKLYRRTGKKEYLELANYFIRTRGEKPCYFLSEDCIKNKNYHFAEFEDFDLDYCQAHMPLMEQTTAEGHAVRAVYLYSAMADLAYEYQDQDLFLQCEKIWNNIVGKKLYVTGSIGSASYGERFTTDYDLPNNTNYSESCASIGLAMFSSRMFQITRDGKYMDVVENALYNTILAGISMDGRHFFYVNPLEVVPEIAEKNPTMRHIITTRQLWFGVACCPPNIARTLASLGNYIYSLDENIIYVNLFVASKVTAQLGGDCVELEMQANYPVDGEIKVAISLEKSKNKFTVAIRKPGFSNKVLVKVNGQVASFICDKGYIYIEREWEDKDEITISLDVAFRYVHCNPKVRDNIGKVCVMRGPWVYCLEEVDNGEYLSSIVVDTSKEIEEEYDPSLLNGLLCAKLKGKKIDYSEVKPVLYDEGKPQYIEQTFKAIPYCSWNNRGKGEMLVWMKEME
ncbi:glycosyhydrolase [Sporanaerobium hydrogeniformans]|uniref:Glycosyhydrolase n=1 Tax=Sporanaerobium hydrogeniformans TaxID=3072179 RepID=A0AC61D9D9_9FIRM|nr:beta-L-arabinofuranosidase domain-containing protein [Sporanaerobium hydrogeniformans]PHV69627.1 glycosyhydrolase [Sporanaerobium hydrogeniformans]